MKRDQAADGDRRGWLPRGRMIRRVALLGTLALVIVWAFSERHVWEWTYRVL